MGVLQLHHHATVTPLVLTEHQEGYLDTPQCSGNTKVLHHGVFNSACQIIGCSGSTSMLVHTFSATVTLSVFSYLHLTHLQIFANKENGKERIYN